MLPKFEKGDRVRIKPSRYGRAPAGETGIVVRAMEPDYYISLDKYREPQHPWDFIVHAEYLEPVENEDESK